MSNTCVSNLRLVQSFAVEQCRFVRHSVRDVRHDVLRFLIKLHVIRDEPDKTNRYHCEHILEICPSDMSYDPGLLWRNKPKSGQDIQQQGCLQQSTHANET